jgi:hypothetical protein
LHLSYTGAQVEMGICDCPNGGCNPQYTLPNTSQMSSAYLTVDNQTPVVGDRVYSPCMPQTAGQCTWEITAVGSLGTSMGNRSSSTDCDIPGCTDPLATNYNAAATVDDGSCTYPVNICNDQLWVNMPDGTPSNGGKINYCIRCSVNNNNPNSPNPQTSPEPLVWLSATPPYWNTSGPNATQNYCSCCPITWPPYYPMVAPSGNNTNITPAISKPKDKEIKQIDKPDPQIDRMKTLANIKPK